MKENRMNCIRLWGIFVCLAWMGTTALWATKPVVPEHSIQFGYGLGYSSYHTSINKKPLSRFMIDYAYDLRWKPIRTNFFVTGNVSYIGYLSHTKHYDLNRFHISAGIGFNIHLTNFLNLSFAYSPGFSYEKNVRCTLNETVNTGNHMYRRKEIIQAYRALFSIRLTGEVKNVRIGIGLEETDCLLFLIDPDYFLSLSVGYRF